jgi:inorganic pyrophosphatase
LQAGILDDGWVTVPEAGTPQGAPLSPFLSNVVLDELDKELGMLKLDRVLYSSIHYPGDYGFIPQTFYEDGDPLDVLVMVSEPSFPGCVIEARPLGLFRMTDRGLPDEKILACGPRPASRDYHDITDIPQHFLHEAANFFAVYKDLKGQRQTIGWKGREARKASATVELFQSKTPGLQTL